MKSRTADRLALVIALGAYGPWILLAIAWAAFVGALAGWWTP